MSAHKKTNTIIKTDVNAVRRRRPGRKPEDSGSAIIKIDNPYRRWERTNLPIVPGQRLSKIRARPDVINTIPIETDAVIAINGHIIPIEQWGSRRIREDDYLLIAPRAAGPGGGIITAIIWLTVKAAIYAGISYGVSLLVDSLSSKPKKPSRGFDEDELSQSFGWRPATLHRQGLPVPRFYGLNKMYGNVTAAHTEITGAATNLLRQYALISLGTGPYRDVVIDGTMKINDQLIENFDDVYCETRRGNLRQARVSYFDKTLLEVAPGGEGRLVVNGSPITYETGNANFDNLEIDLAFPQGLYDASGGGLANNTVNVTLEIKKTTASAWQTLVTGDITDDTTDMVIRTYKTDGAINIERGYNYQVRATKNTAERDDIEYGDDLYLYRVREVIDAPFTYPRRALVGIKALATDQLSGSIRFSCYSRCLYVRVYENSAWTIKYSNNPAWVAYDILTQPVYSGAHSPWLDLKLLLNFEGADAATSTVDDSTKGHTITFGGGAELDTAEQYFGSASGLLDGVDSYWQIANDDDSFDMFENLVEDWTFDIYLKMGDHAGTEVYCGQYVDANNYWSLSNIHGSGMSLIVKVGGVQVISVTFAAGEIDDTNWHHIALIKVGAAIGMYLDENQIGYDLMVAADVGVFDSDFFIGQDGNGAGFLFANVDHFRIIKSNVFSAAPNSGLTDTITEPAAEYTDPGHSFAVERYDGYDPSKLNTSDFEDLADWCDETRDNPNKMAISSISLAEKAIINLRSIHNLKVGDRILFHNVAENGMVELTEETIAEVMQIISDMSLSVDIDTSGYTPYLPYLKLLYHFQGVPIQRNLCLGGTPDFNVLGSENVSPWFSTAINMKDDSINTKVGFNASSGIDIAYGNYEAIIEFAQIASVIIEVNYYRYWQLSPASSRNGYEKVYLYYSDAWHLINTESYMVAGSGTGLIRITAGAPWNDVTKVKIVAYMYANGAGNPCWCKHHLFELRAFGTIGTYDGDGAIETLDSSPQGHDAGPNNFIGDAQIDTDESKWGGSALLSDGTGDFIRLPASEDWEIVENITDDWTIDFFARFADHAGTEALLAIESATDYWALQHVHGSGLQFLNKIGGVTKIDTGAAGEITDTNWHHIALCKVADEIGVYLDDDIVGHDTIVDGDKATYNDDITIMGRGTSDPFQGHIDELRISKSNEFGAAPDAGLTDTITSPTSQHSSGTGVGTIEEHKRRFAFNGGFDTESNMWKAAISVCELCRSMLFWKGNQISVTIDKSATAVYAYTVGDIIEGSFKVDYLPLADRASEIEAHYRDARKDYERTPFTLYNADIGNPTQKVRLDLFGIIDVDTAERLVNHKLLMNKHLKKKVSFEADIDAIGNTIGDVVKVQHDITNWGRIGSGDEHYTGGGRIVKAEISGSDTIITIAGEIKFDDADWRGGATTYKIMVQTADDIPPETKTIIGFTESSIPGGTYDITAEGTFTTLPAKDDKWAAGVENLEAKEFRITDMEVSNEKTVAIEGMEYVEAIYADD